MLPNQDSLSTCSEVQLSTTSGTKVTLHLPDGSIFDSNRLITSQMGKIWFEAPASGCRNKDSIVVQKPEPKISQINLTSVNGYWQTDTLIANLPVQIKAAESGGFCSPIWRLNEGENLAGNPVSISISEEGPYLLEVESSSFLNCKALGNKRFFIQRTPERIISIPNLSTPNGDGKNETLVIQNIVFHPQHRLQLFNRWGKRMVDSQSYQNDWQVRREPIFITFRLKIRNGKVGFW